ncbi:MAG: hypothetical protein AAFV25_05955, partial [Bacteroidota bacterium]
MRKSSIRQTGNIAKLHLSSLGFLALLAACFVLLSFRMFHSDSPDATEGKERAHAEAMPPGSDFSF